MDGYIKCNVTTNAARRIRCEGSVMLRSTERKKQEKVDYFATGKVERRVCQTSLQIEMQQRIHTVLLQIGKTTA